MLQQRFLKETRPSRQLIVIGASGSIGQTCLNYIQKQPSFQLIGASIHKNILAIDEALLNHRSLRYLAISGVYSVASRREICSSLEKRNSHLQIFFTAKGITEMIDCCSQAGADTAVMAIPGTVAIGYTAQCLTLGLKVAVANKEAIVTAGPAFRWLLSHLHQQNSDTGDARLAQLEDGIRHVKFAKSVKSCEASKLGEKEKVPPSSQRKAVLLPVDSEHNALFQLSRNLPKEQIRRWILTSSGGPLLHYSPEEVKKAKKK